MTKILLQKLHDVDPNDSDAVKEALSSFFPHLSNYTETDCNRWLQALENVINRFPKFCTSHRSTIETYLINFLDSKNLYHVISAAKCAHALQQVKPFQDKATTPQACWHEQMNILCNAAYSLINDIFTGSVNIHENDNAKLKTDFNILGKTALTKALVRIHKRIKTGKQAHNKLDIQMIKLRNVFIFLQAMLVEIYPAAKPICPQIILEVIVKILSVTSSINKETIQNVATVKIEALRTINALVACLGPNLIPFSQLVFRLIMQTLKWCSENPCEELRKVRCAAYNSLTKWLRVLNVHRPSREGRGRLWEDELTSNIIDDIIPPKKVVQLTMNSQSMKKLSKKAKRKLANTMLQESAIATHIPGENNKISTSEEICDDIAIAALECAETFLSVCGIFLKPATHKIFQEHLVRECCSLFMYNPERGLWLLRVLESARKAVSPNVPPPTQYCLHLYSRLVNTHQGEIQKFCSNALLDIRLHLHCSPPSLTFAMDVRPETKNKAESKRKFMSERNRAMLESLLGAERISTKGLNQNKEDVITIPDEPSNKKPRLQDNIDDRISLSSDSINSIEISDDSEDEAIIVQEVKAAAIDNRKENTDKEPEIDFTIRDNAESNKEELRKESVQIENDNDSLNGPAGDEVIIEIETDKNVEDRSGLINVKSNEEKKLCVEEINNDEIQDKESIYEVKTQLPLNASTETLEDDERPHSMEVAYDYPNTGKDRVTILEKTDDENLPSTNDTDDIQITCGQDVKDSQGDSIKNVESLELAIEKNSENEMAECVPLENGINTLLEKNIENGQVEIDTCVDVSIKTVNKEDALTVEDMLADFVDEVNDEKHIEV